MKKTAKSVLLALMMVVLMLALTGCGEKKIVGTAEEDDVKSTVEIKYDKNDKATEIKMIYECKSNDDAKEATESFKKELGEKDGITVKQSGKKVTVTMKVKAFAESYGLDYDKNADKLTKDSMKEMFESMGYKF
ncbi:MAG: hypothetical protein IJ890_09025 [Clostridia bacterium]|nr:hypothetical protein [Clostridia bacterium]